MRKDKINYYIDIAKATLQRSTCIRRNFDAILVKNDEIISTDYNESLVGRKNCTDLECCMREKLNIPRGERYELCKSVYGEKNAIISTAGKDMIERNLFLVGKTYDKNEYVKDSKSCAMCKRIIINSDIEKINIKNTKTKYIVIDINEFIEKDETLEGILGY